MEKNLLKKRMKSLTLIVIIGILSGVLLAVIDPTRQTKRARQTVFRVNAEKGCLALHACTGSTQTAVACSGETNSAALTAIGFQDSGNPAGATYAIAPLLPIPAGANLTLTSTYETCVFTCSATPKNGTVVNFALTIKGVACIIS